MTPLRPNPIRSLTSLAGLGALVALAAGCTFHTYQARDEWYDRYRRADAGYYDGFGSGDAGRATYGYVGGHVIPSAYGGGWCFVEGPHVHSYPPDVPSYYISIDGYFSYRGPVSFYYYGGHPIPAEYGGGWCYRRGRHVHRYHPARQRGWLFDRGRGYYWYDANEPRRDPHPAEPAWAERHPRGEPVRGGWARPAPARGRPATTHPARPVTGTSDDGVEDGLVRWGEDDDHHGHAAHERDEHDRHGDEGHHGHAARRDDDEGAPVRRYGGWQPSPRSDDLGDALSDHGGTYVPPRDTTPETPIRGYYTGATGGAHAPTYGATRVDTSPTYRVSPPAPTVRGTPVGTATATPGRPVDTRWHGTPVRPIGTTGTVGGSRVRPVRIVGPAKAERVKRAAKDKAEVEGLKKRPKATRLRGATIRLMPTSR
ncbi:MAG: hypothetical protein D6729_02525 [Deltaproteobacteria bacterium]|nr:MAG: hypothetical protein D6729_02525 [Deltaproteobacteria bacterium]